MIAITKTNLYLCQTYQERRREMARWSLSNPGKQGATSIP